MLWSLSIFPPHLFIANYCQVLNNCQSYLKMQEGGYATKGLPRNVKIKFLLPSSNFKGRRRSSFKENFIKPQIFPLPRILHSFLYSSEICLNLLSNFHIWAFWCWDWWDLTFSPLKNTLQKKLGHKSTTFIMYQIIQDMTE